MSEAATKIAVGTLNGIMEKTAGWFQIQVSVPGKNYPVKMDTKKQELVELARAAGQDVMEWTFTEKDSGNPNPNRPGENFINRYLEGVDPVGSNPASSVATPESAPQSGMSKEDWQRKDSAIHKMACIKTAADALKHTVPSEPSAEDLATFISRVTTLTLAWHRSVLAERDDPTGEDVPF